MIFVICSKSAEITGEVIDYPYLPFLFHVLCRVFKVLGEKRPSAARASLGGL